MTSTLANVSGRKRRIRAEHGKPKHGNAYIKVHSPGSCCVCPATWSLTKHHVFGNKDGLTIQLCRNCHFALHQEIDSGAVGPFGRHVFAILGQVFPVTSDIPKWTEDDDT